MTQFTRRVALAAVVAVLAVASPAAAQKKRSGGGGSLPIIDMGALVKAAQIDPWAPGHTTAGSRVHVRRVERLLRQHGFPPNGRADGEYGMDTLNAYAAWQRHLGYGGLDATGLPGKTSLLKLAEGRFRVVNIIDPGPRVPVDGVTTNRRTKRMLRAAQRLLGEDLVVLKGSYNTTPGTSAGTHDGGGALDIFIGSTDAHTVFPIAKRRHIARALRRVGFAAWIRNPEQGDWDWHIHAIAISDTDLSPQAQHQVSDYYRGIDGLATHSTPDNGPKVRPRVTWEEYLRRSGS